jgi:malonyl-CoA/methylmalonyl-CoA synthetase
LTPGSGDSAQSAAALAEAAPGPSAVRAWAEHVGDEINPDALRLDLSQGDLPSAFHRIAVEAGDRRALTIGERSISYRDLDRNAGTLAAWLRARGAQPGDRVVLCGSNSIEFVIAHLGVLRTGAVDTLAGSTLTERELRHVVTHSGAVGGFASGDAVGRLEALAADTAMAWVVSLEPDAGAQGLEGALNVRGTLRPGGLENRRPAILGYTSGTTGNPKGAPLSHANVLSSVRGVMWAWRWREDDLLVHSLPLTHAHGLTGLHATLLSGARAVIQPSLDPATLCETIAAERATVLFAVPAVYERLLAWGEGAPQDFASLRLATSGSAPLSPRLWERARELVGAEPLERYGTTESGLDVSNPYDGARLPGSVGTPLPGIEVAITDADGLPLADGGDGEVLVRGPQVFAGYWQDERATVDSFRPGDWFRTGDIGRVDPQNGYLEITGRIKELIITGGLNVYPREVELALEQHPAVERAAVVGIPSDRWGEEVVAFVVGAGGTEVDPDEIRAHARGLLAPYKCPKTVREAEELPVNTLGKVLRPELVAQARRDAANDPGDDR